PGRLDFPLPRACVSVRIAEYGVDRPSSREGDRRFRLLPCQSHSVRRRRVEPCLHGYAMSLISAVRGRAVVDVPGAPAAGAAHRFGMFPLTCARVIHYETICASGLPGCSYCSAPPPAPPSTSPPAPSPATRTSTAP